MGAQHVPVGSDDRDFLDRHRGEHSLPHDVERPRLARIDAARRETVERLDHHGKARIGERGRSPRRGANLGLPLPFDESASQKSKAIKGSPASNTPAQTAARFRRVKARKLNPILASG